MQESELLDRRRAITLRDLIQFAMLAAALIANYVALSNRMSVLETKVQILYEERPHAR